MPVNIVDLIAEYINTSTDLDNVSCSNRIYLAIRSFILDGKLPPGTELPSVRILSDGLVYAPATISNAYRKLSNDLYIIPRKTKPYIVAETKPIDAAISNLVKAAKAMSFTLTDTIRLVEDNFNAPSVFVDNRLSA